MVSITMVCGMPSAAVPAGNFVVPVVKHPIPFPFELKVKEKDEEVEGKKKDKKPKIIVVIEKKVGCRQSALCLAAA